MNEYSKEEDKVLSPVENAHQQLDASISILEDVVARLVNRLEPIRVIYPTVPGDSSQRAIEASPPQSAMHTAVTSANIRVNIARARIEDVINELEI